MGALWFWALATLSCALLAACMLVPPWYEHNQLAQAVAHAEMQVARMKLQWQDQREMAHALEYDPAVAERALVEELNYSRPGELSLSVPQVLPDLAAALPQGADRIRPQLRWVLNWADRHFVAALLQKETRQHLLALAMLTLLAATLLFDPDEYLRPNAAKRRKSTTNR